MARPIIIRDETILEAARQVFLERGIQATTAEVAERAGVSEGSIFKRFKTKFELFQAAVVERTGEPFWPDRLMARIGEGEVRDNLVVTGMEILDFFRSFMPLFLLAWSSPGPSGLPVALTGPDSPARRAHAQMTAYLEAEMRAGRVRQHDPEIVARVFLGGINNYAFFGVLLRANDDVHLTEETYMRGLVDLLWAGLEPAPGDGAGG